MEKDFSAELSRRIRNDQERKQKAIREQHDSEKAAAEQKKKALQLRSRICILVRDYAAETADTLLLFGYETTHLTPRIKAKNEPEPVTSGELDSLWDVVKAVFKDAITPPPDLTKEQPVWILTQRIERTEITHPYGTGYWNNCVGICLSEAGELFSYETKELSSKNLYHVSRLADSEIAPLDEIVVGIKEPEQQPLVQAWQDMLFNIISK